MKKISLFIFSLISAGILSAQNPKAHTRMDTIMSQLSYVFKTDQQYRLPLQSTIDKYGWNSRQVDSLEEGMAIQDSINLQIVTQIIDTYGWIGPDSIGPNGNTTLWVIIQHSDLDVQLKYLPIMRDAVQHGRARPADLAYLEDRVAVQQGKKQLYGTQFQLDKKTNRYILAPIEDEPNVDKRRAAIGLNSLEAYARDAGIEYRLPPQTPPSQPPH